LNRGPADSHETWKVARATSAAPTYFDPIRIENKEYFDGGLGNNNPVYWVLSDVTAKANIVSWNEALGVVVSIGTGQKPTARLKVKHRFPKLSSLRPVKEISKIVKKLQDTATEVDKDHKLVSTLLDQIGFRHYYRWTGGEDVGGLGLDEWHTRPKGNKPTTANFIENRVREYMTQTPIQDSVRACARELVNRRRDRIAYQPHLGFYRRHAHCTMIPCPYCTHLCQNRAAVRSHIENIHSKDLTPAIPLDLVIQRVKEVPPRYRGGPL
jgi:predicted acylesterase/phospholipase RssA